jgi:predicted ATP-grasp superfamily ATP-dependent carboligase
VLVKAHNFISIVKRYHGLIQRAYQIIVSEIPELDKDIALQMAFKAINNSAGLDGLVLILLVFGAYPKIIELNVLFPTITQRATAIKKAMAEIHKLQAKR